MSEKFKAKKGLDGIIADDTHVSHVEVEEKRLHYFGYDINDLCANCSFEEVTYLMLHGELPNWMQLKDYQQVEAHNRNLPTELVEILQRTPKYGHPMDYLKLGVDYLGIADDHNKVGENSLAINLRKALWLIPKLPTLVANSYRITHDMPLVLPDHSKSFSENFLYMMRGKEAENELEIKLLEASLILYAEHSFNASTFTSRVVASTLSDYYSAISAAIGALKGPLHGGANEQVMHMLLEIGSVDKAEAFLRDKIANKAKVMGFGHRIYRKGDSRVGIMTEMGKELAEKKGLTKWHDISAVLEKIMVEEKGIFPNLDFPAATAYYLLDIPIELYTPIFVVARITGWTAHIIEQHEDNRIIRPEANYIGPAKRTVNPLKSRK
ncbi:citrate/2-methylcitrate synthase [Marinoscillum sp. MHG1-6]|uniref:citrate/2-methylcitrate synthase n=1 Tax=Marinoscillum sp. MHG1-6 TaxID=2959627 RepID=UPI0021570B0A|nr:citrate/2-methylcitrate synthase [Marinoscillum sp. MHG1-6]